MNTLQNNYYQYLLHKTSLNTLLFIILIYCISCSSNNSITDYVDPFIGTDGTGHTFPGATMPFGMVQLSPDTRNSGWENCSGYHSTNNTILGFSHTHLSGTGAIDYGDILVMPMAGKYYFNAGDENDSDNGYRSRFSKENEIAEPGYYCVDLLDDKIKAEMTVTSRVGFHRYTFPKNQSPHILFDLQHGLGDNVIESSIKIISQSEISGLRRSSGWAKDQYVYFYAKFSKPFSNFKIIENNNIRTQIDSILGKNIKSIFSFENLTDPLIVKVSLSAVNEKGAKMNMEKEASTWDFDLIRQMALKKWEKELSIIKIKGGSKKDRIKFYTALYHSFIAPNIYHDVDGKYRGADLEIKTLSESDSMYTVFSLWDTFRATHPLFVLLKPAFAEQLVRTLITKASEGNLLPVWELAANETGTMIGYHSTPVIVDAYIKGLQDINHELALEQMVESSMQNHLGLESYKSKGYIPLEKENESISKTLEYAYDDWCIAVMAEKLGKSTLANKYFRRSLNYLNVYDKNVGFFRGKKFGNWVSPFNPSEVNSIYTEANAWQYNFFVPHDISGMISMMGGDIIFNQKLDELFTTSSKLIGRHQPDITGLIGQYAHGNEPSHNFAYLYNYIGKAYKTQNRVRQIMDDLYTVSRDGLSGNEDCGQMSSWYVFSAMGFYPVTPGQNIYAIGTPIFDEVTINLNNINTFKIKAKNASSINKYIHSATLNGSNYSKSYISHEQIVEGGVLEFKMNSKPNTSWGQSRDSKPMSFIDKKVVMNPTISAPSRAFSDSMTISMHCGTKGSSIFYTLNGDTPSINSIKYENPINLKETTIVKAISLKTNYLSSYIETVVYKKLPYIINIEYHEPYNEQYTAGGHYGLFDTIRGTPTAWGTWQGFLGKDFFVTIDLGDIRPINSVSATFLQKPDSWIWLPKSVSFELSTDGKNFSEIKSYDHNISLKEYEPTIIDFEQEIANPIRYIRVRAKNMGACPEWHPGSGDDSWVFIDEITLK
tara:strand:+ start:201 stop:3188 length:2988 start_codon:yes stop_codon:yes gene_type:complete